MATEEITITELELAEEILGDMVLAVDTSTATKSISLKQLKDYLGTNLPTGFILPAVGRINDARFTLLDGKTLAKNGTYSAFCAKVEEQVSAGNWFSCTEEEFNADISKYGQCGRFVITSEYVRIPKITSFIGATVTLSEIGKTYAESLPNIKGSFYTDSMPAPEGAFYDMGVSSPYVSGSTAGTKVGFDPSRSSEAYQDGAKVQPDHTRYPYYMVVGSEGQKEQITVDINKVYEDLELKANSNLSNVNQQGKDTAINWLMPDFDGSKAETLVNPIPWNTSFQLPCDALVIFGCYSNSASSDGILRFSKDGVNFWQILCHDEGYMINTIVLPKGIYIKATGGTSYQELSYTPLRGASQ